jgi:hypothetical protein
MPAECAIVNASVTATHYVKRLLTCFATIFHYSLGHGLGHEDDLRLALGILGAP